ncbi:SseB family protein [Tateyamaria omphalii]|uniref:SseB family protein n=1 Tax=Tateyamaria omphalii TaxID=299262 RepID=UPI001C992DFD|nr:SseB family protein [Tateyamaria omphalii]MBY5933919.1 SseB family protein [Tateyamaria omphalii]
MTETVLDQAHAAMQAAQDDDTVRLRFFERLGDAELFLLLEGEVEGDQVSPQVFDPGTGPMVLVFDREERLSSFVGAQAPYAALSGRVIVRLLAEQKLGLGLNLDVAPSSFLLDADGVQWLAQVLDHAPDEVEARLAELSAPTGLPDALITALDTKLATATGLAQAAYLVGTTDAEGMRGHMLAFVGAAPGAEDALAQAASEALTFSGIEAGAMDVGFFDGRDPVTERLARAGLRFDLPQPAPARAPEPAAPGTDPNRPPRLR